MTEFLVSFELPAISRRMEILVENLSRDPGGEVPTEARDAARALLRETAHLVEPAARELVVAWMAEVVKAVVNPPSAADFERRIDSLMIAGETTPGAAWNRKNLRIALASWKHWPSAAEVFGLLDPDETRIRNWERGLCRVAGWPNRFERANQGLPAPLRVIEGGKDSP